MRKWASHSTVHQRRRVAPVCTLVFGEDSRAPFGSASWWGHRTCFDMAIKEGLQNSVDETRSPPLHETKGEQAYQRFAGKNLKSLFSDSSDQSYCASTMFSLPFAG